MRAWKSSCDLNLRIFTSIDYRAVGILFIGSRDQPHLSGFKLGLQERGYVDGKTIILAYCYMAKILQGAKGCRSSIEQPTRFEFVVNSSAAQEIGVTVPPKVLARADRLIR